MKERPILFSGPMVRAILSGAQTQMRRALKPQPYFDNRGLLWWEWSRSAGSASIDPVGQPSDEWLKHCPYGAPGDVLWVRETWAPCEAPIRSGFIQYAADGAIGRRVSLLGVWVGKPSKWRPSIHMPRWASRLSLRIKSVRVERLQEISDVDAISEGIAHNVLRDGGYSLPDTSHYHASDPRASFCSLWESINGAGSWAANPLVWVVEFEVMK